MKPSSPPPAPPTRLVNNSANPRQEQARYAAAVEKWKEDCRRHLEIATKEKHD